jgi:nucleotide-binding universal stress UspA family protein
MKASFPILQLSNENSLYNVYKLIKCNRFFADVDLYWPHVTSEFTRNMRNEGEKYLNKVKVKANEKDIQIKTEIISSKDISGGILDFAQENNIDLIVIGTRGRSGFKRLLLGSVASHVVTYAHCPMLVVK